MFGSEISDAFTTILFMVAVLACAALLFFVASIVGWSAMSWQSWALIVVALGVIARYSLAWMGAS